MTSLGGRIPDVGCGVVEVVTLELCGEGRDAAKRVAWVGVTAWDVGLDWML